MSDWGEDALHHKYDPLPEDAPRHRKKSRKRHVRSDHRHEYEKVCIDAHCRSWFGGEWHPYLHTGERCSVCGRLRRVRRMPYEKPCPDGMRLFDVTDYLQFITMREMPEELEVTDAGRGRLLV